MKKILLILILAVAGTCGAAARTALQFFADSAAITAIPLIDPISRLDMVDYFASKHPKASRNVLGGDAMILHADSTSMAFRITSRTTCSLDVATVGRDTVLVFVETVQLPAPDCSVMLYNSDWTPRDKAFARPTLDDWLTDEGKTQRADAEGLLPFVLFTARYNHDTGNIELTHSMDSYYIDADQRGAVARWLKPMLRISLKNLKITDR